METIESALARFSLVGRTALVVGAGPGIGSHVAHAFAEAGARVVVSARTPTKVDQVAASIRAAGGDAIGVAADAASKQDVRRLVAAARAEYGPPHILFFNAHTGSIPIDSDPFVADDDVWERAVALNILAPYRLAKLLVPDMIKAGYGSIINVLTCAAFTPILPQIAYGTTKAALQMMTRYLAKAGQGIVRANCICPGSMTPDGTNNPGFAAHVAKNAIPRPGLSDEVVGAALLLASPASSYTTGQTIFCEGGRVGTIS